jgi:hypothetical protein
MLLLVVLPGVRDKFCVAEGGLLLANCRWRADIASLLDIVVERPGLAGAFGEDARWLAAPFTGWFVALFTGALLVRPAANRLVLIVRTGI